MPFTPYHFGPGALFKAAGRRRFSFGLFVLSQVFIDLEPLYFMVRGETPAHRLFHTFAGSVVTIFEGLFVLAPLYRLFMNGFFRILRIQRTFSLPVPAVLLTLAVGAWSHVLLDSFMHSDMRPFYPWSSANPFLHAVTVPHLYAGCLISGAAGAAVICVNLMKGYGRAGRG